MSAVRIIAQLARDARHFASADGTAYMELCIAQGSSSAPAAIAMRRVGNGSAAQYICTVEAKRYRKGMRVRVDAAGYEIDRQANLLRLVGVDHVELVDVPVPQPACAS